MGNVYALAAPAARRVPPPPLPAKTAAAPVMPSTGGRRGEYALADVARELNLLHFGIRTIIDKLRTMARHDGMPLPRTPRIVKDRPMRGPLVIYSKSRWNAGEFDAWLDGRGPGTPAAKVEAPRAVPRPIADEMARRAANI